VKAGSTLLVQRKDRFAEDVSDEIADNAFMALAPDVPPLRRLAVRASHRDTLASVAHRYHVGIAQLAEWNKLQHNAKLRSGQSLVVFVPNVARPAVASTTRPSVVRPVAQHTVTHARTAVAARKPAPARTVVAAKKAPVKVAQHRGGGGGAVRVTRASK
jgi:membrane-bound lytic murein transglycosylase D